MVAKEIVSAQIWRSASGKERVWGLGQPTQAAQKASPILGGEPHTYVRNEDREWVEYEPLY